MCPFELFKVDGLVTVFITYIDLLADGKAVFVSLTIKCSPFIPCPANVVQDDSFNNLYQDVSLDFIFILVNLVYNYGIKA